MNNIRKELPIEDDSIVCGACESDQGEFHPFVRCTQCKNNYHEICVNASDLSKWICPSCGHENIENPEVCFIEFIDNLVNQFDCLVCIAIASDQTRKTFE